MVSILISFMSSSNCVLGSEEITLNKRDVFLPGSV